MLRGPFLPPTTWNGRLPLQGTSSPWRVLHNQMWKRVHGWVGHSHGWSGADAGAFWFVWHFWQLFTWSSMPASKPGHHTTPWAIPFIPGCPSCSSSRICWWATSGTTTRWLKVCSIGLRGVTKLRMSRYVEAPHVLRRYAGCFTAFSCKLLWVPGSGTTFHFLLLVAGFLNFDNTLDTAPMSTRSTTL